MGTINSLPSGYESSFQLSRELKLDSAVLPWLNEPMTFPLTVCELQGGDSFLVSSVVKSHPKLVAAADGLTKAQNTITDNMFYARIAGFMQHGYGSGIETFRKAVTDFPIKAMRNKGGQRVYFGVPELLGRQYGGLGKVVLRLAVCDKNCQSLVIDVLSNATPGEKRHKNNT